jgi:hypothetical protein
LIPSDDQADARDGRGVADYIKALLEIVALRNELLSCGPSTDPQAR